MSREFTIALTGQPNAGKSTLFNALTGARQFIANYPGVTVEKKTGVYRFNGDKFNVIDLPGTYSLTAYSLEERVARAVILEEKPELAIHVMDASNLARSLSFTFQLAELGCPVIVALNMLDVAKARGMDIDVKRFEKELGLRVSPVIANKGRGVDELKKKIFDMCDSAAKGNPIKSVMNVDYGEELEKAIAEIESELEHMENLYDLPKRWLAIKWMENDSEIENLIKGNKLSNPVFAKHSGDHCG
jgi:ferrous iron transport protein B